MKKCLSLFLLSLLPFLMFAQIPKEAYDLSNGLEDLWHSSPKEKAIDASVKLNKLYPPFLVERIHTGLTQYLQERSKTDYQDYLKALWDLQEPSIRNMIEPIYVWNQSFDVKTVEEAEKTLQAFYALLKDSTNMTSKAELYGLLIIKNLEQKKLVPAELKTKVLDKIISNLQQYPYLEKPDAQRRLIIPRAWHRYLLSYSMYQKYRTEGEDPRFLKAASTYSPDETDLRRTDGYYYDAFLLAGTDDVSYKSIYIDYLDKNKSFKEELPVLLDMVYSMPINSHIQQLKDFLAKYTEMGAYQKVWSNYVNSRMQSAPALQIAFEGDVLDFTKSRSNWTFIDVWGSWCSPCCKELPHLNETASKYNSLASSKVRIRSFSYMSTNLKDFLKKNNYTFPVAEVSREVTTAFGVESFPTKLLVSPDNKYLVIPYNVNWEEYMRNYCLVE